MKLFFLFFIAGALSMTGCAMIEKHISAESALDALRAINKVCQKIFPSDAEEPEPEGESGEQ